jgi:hypothetical protein
VGCAMICIPILSPLSRLRGRSDRQDYKTRHNTASLDNRRCSPTATVAPETFHDARSDDGVMSQGRTAARVAGWYLLPVWLPKPRAASE